MPFCSFVSLRQANYMHRVMKNATLNSMSLATNQNQHPIKGNGSAKFLYFRQLDESDFLVCVVESGVFLIMFVF